MGSVRDFPYCPELKTLVITDRHCEKAENYSNFKNLPSLEYLEFKSLFNYNDNSSDGVLQSLILQIFISYRN